MGRGIKLAAMHVGDYVAPDSGANPDCWVGSSMVEQRPFKPLAGGSSPTRPTIKNLRCLKVKRGFRLFLGLQSHLFH